MLPQFWVAALKEHKLLDNGLIYIALNPWIFIKITEI